jgi:2-oxo-3-hexenedioate decarboxylase
VRVSTQRATDVGEPALVELAARRLHEARLARRPIDPLTDEHADLDLATAYAIQEAGVGLRVATGERIVGGKLGFTSQAMQQAMGVDEPNRAWLTDAMVVHDGRIRLGDLVHPKAEPEIALVLDRDLDGAAGPAEILAATRTVHACLEVVDSRYRDFRFRAADNIADGSSAGQLVLGPGVPLPDRPLAALRCELHVDGRTSAHAEGAAALGDPAAAAAWMARHVADHPRGLRAGDIVLTGGLTAPVTLVPGQRIEAIVEELGTAALEVLP